MTFSSKEFLVRTGRKLVSEFDDARQANTPGLIGSAREHPARKSLERLLPGATAVGSGLVIDSSGGVSKQQDIVIYEGDWCPVFSVNETPEATFYPCEGVIAVGEVKSALGTKELEDAFEKMASAKRLRRYAVPEASDLVPERTVAFRKFGMAMSMAGTKEEEFDQATKGQDQIFGFILCNEFALKSETLLDRAYDLWRSSPKAEAPNLIVSLREGYLSPFDSRRSCLTFSPMDADGIAFCHEDGAAMPRLMRMLNDIVRSGRTVETKHFLRYFPSQGKQNSFTTKPF